MNTFAGFKTITFNVVALVVALLQYFGGPLPPVDPEVFAISVPTVNFILRLVTKTPAFTK